MVQEQKATEAPIEDIFRNNLKIESNPMSIETLFTGRLRNRITYDPYYQRNYVWDKLKATYFIESILLGTEIPPLIFFNSGGRIEVVDGRQRFQTIDRYIRGDFELAERGLFALKSLKGIKFDDLSESIRNAFLDTALRVIEFAIVVSDRVTDVQEDTVKKEVFRRYNSGITPLRKSEIETAEFIEDSITQYFREQFNRNRGEYADVIRILASERSQSRIDEPRLLDDIMILIRKLLVLHAVPISYYQNASGKEVARLIYEDRSENADPEAEYKDFTRKIQLLKSYHRSVTTKNPANNHYLYETLYWSLAILEKEGVEMSCFEDPDVIKNFSRYVQNQSHVYDAEAQLFRAVTIARFETTLGFFDDRFTSRDLNGLYVSNSIRRLTVREFRASESPPNDVQDYTIHRLNKPDAQTITVENLNSRMHRKRFLVRPSYQRYEVKSLVKASAIIESMLLGIKLPPIFVFNRENGVQEVIDGQQRVLAIFGFMGKEFLDERGEWSRSLKDGFRLRKLRILKELNGKSFDDLDTMYQDKLWDFNLYMVNIEEKINPGFEPVDLFIRLNNKPYPIKDNTFEMWNSYVDRTIIEELRGLACRYQEWCYLRRDNKRMDNENLYTILAYLEYHNSQGGSGDALEFYTRSEGINSRLRSTSQVTKVLESLSENTEERKRFLGGMRAVESFIKRKVKPLLIDEDVHGDIDLYLSKELSGLFDSSRRTRNQFYVLWYVLSGISTTMIVQERGRIRVRIGQVMRFIKSTETVTEEAAIEVFHDMVTRIWEDHRQDGRKLRLSDAEKESRIREQGNICPLCKKSLYTTDDVEVDHITPISLGGKDTAQNIQVVHWICNRVKGNKIP